MAVYGEAYTVSRMLESINETMGDAGNVQLKRNVGNGVALDTNEKEIAYLDTQAKIKSSVERVAGMNRNEKELWIEHHRKKGNDLFNHGEYSKASDVYLAALTGIELEGTDRQIIQSNVQHPITCNIVACMLKLEQWGKAVKMASVVLNENPRHLKALMQRSKAYMKQEEFEKSRIDAKNAHDLAPNDNAISKLLEAIQRDEHACKKQLHAQKLFQRNMMKKMGCMYEDKKPITQNVVAKNSTWLEVFQVALRSISSILDVCFKKRKQS